MSAKRALLTVTGVLLVLLGPIPALGQSSSDWQVARGAAVRGDLAPGDAVMDSDDSYFDAYVLPVSAGQVYTIRLDSNEFDPYLIVRDFVEGDVLEDDDGGQGTNSALEFSAGSSGFVVIQANSYEASTGSYTLTVE